MLQDFQQRVVDEKTALDEKVEKLGAFLKSDKFKALSDFDKGMLSAQFGHMCSYSAVLGIRISHF